MSFTDSGEILSNSPIVRVADAASPRTDDNENTIFKQITDDTANKTTAEQPNDSDAYDDSAYIIPIKIILPVAHVHAVPENGTYEQFNYILLQTNDSTYHGHLSNDKPDILHVQNATSADEQHTTHRPDNSSSSAALGHDDDNNGDHDNNKNQTTLTPTTNATISTISDDIHIDTDELVPANSATEGSGSGTGPSPEEIVPDIRVRLIDDDGFIYAYSNTYEVLDEDGNVAVKFGDVSPVRPIKESVDLTTPHSVARQQSDDEQYDYHYSSILKWVQFKLE